MDIIATILASVASICAAAESMLPEPPFKRVGVVVEMDVNTGMQVPYRLTEDEYKEEIRRWTHNPFGWADRPKRDTIKFVQYWHTEACLIRVVFDDIRSPRWVVFIISKDFYDSLLVGDRVVVPYDEWRRINGIIHKE